MKYDLLLRLYDKQCELFISGLIPLKLFQEIESEYLKRKKLFIIFLN